MARTKTITINEQEYTLQSVTFSWYANLTDLFVNPANGRKNTAKYADALIKGCVTAPAEVASASDSSAPLILGSLPSLSSISALAATPISVPSVSNMSTNRNASIMVIKSGLKMPEKSSLPNVGMIEGIARPFEKFGSTENIPSSAFGT